MLRTTLLSAGSLAAAGLAFSAALPAQVWIHSTPANAPSPRAELCGAFDLGRGETVIFGGRDRGGLGIPETWTFDGTNWTLEAPANVPPGRLKARMSFDATRNVAVMYGGESGGSTFDGTWEWDGTDWTAMRPANNPGQRHSHGMAFDLLRGRTVMFGGFLAGSTFPQADTWEYDGTDWVQITTANSPPARDWPAMAYDVSRNVVVLYGGYDTQGGAYLSDTWEYDGTDWTEVDSISAEPPGRKWHEIVYDLSLNRIVLHAGFQSGSRGDTWQYDGYDWVEMTSVTGPTTSQNVFVYDAVRGTSVCFGGTFGPFLNDTDSYIAGMPAQFTAYGAGCNGSVGDPELDALNDDRPYLGQPFDLEIQNIPASAAAITLVIGFQDDLFSGLTLPLDLGVIGMPGCLLATSMDIQAPIPAAGGFATPQLAIPNAAGWTGQEIFFQALILDPGANPLGVTISNPGRGVIGS